MVSESANTPRHEFRTLASREVYSGAIVALRIDEVEMPNGATAEREIVEHYGAVAIVALDESDKVVLISQYRHAVARRLLELPAGLLDVPHEDSLAAAQRELAEEVGLAARDWSVLVDLALSPGFCDEVLRVYLATGLTEVDRPEPEHEEADLEVIRMPLTDAVRACLAGEVVNASTAAGILALSASRGVNASLRNAGAPWPIPPSSFTSG